MKLFKIFLLGWLLHSAAFAQDLTLSDINMHLQKSLYANLKGQNRSIVQEIYAQNGNQPLWVGEENKEKMNALIKALNDPLFNYKEKPFDQPNIMKLLYLMDNNAIAPSQKAAMYARLDLLLTNTYVRLVRFIVQGDVNWDLVQEKLAALKRSDDIAAHWDMTYKALPDANALLAGTTNGDIHGYLVSLLPLEQRYKKLVALLKRYRALPAFPKVEYAEETLKLGDSGSRVEQVKLRLQVEGDYPKNARIDRNYDKTLQRAVAQFQNRYNIAVDGKVNKITTFYMNMPKSDNIKSIITNLDKTKLYPNRFEDEYILSNIPDFRLTYYKNDMPYLNMALVVGRIDRPTPLFHDQVRFMVLNPTWTVPDNLIKRDLIHVLRENPRYLEENNIKAYAGNKEIQIRQSQLDPYENSSRVVPFRFVQQPGEKNALGRVKFMFPNKYDVYLHDTDNKTLFKQRYRVYSSGCMRVAKPMELMRTLLEHAPSRQNVDEILAKGEPATINLRQPVPVHVVYFTAYEENGLGYFRNDIYLYDRIIQESVQGNMKRYFKVPEKRLIDIKKNGQTVKAVSN